jgi:hypothetical protein
VIATRWCARIRAAAAAGAKGPELDGPPDEPDVPDELDELDEHEVASVSAPTTAREASADVRWVRSMVGIVPQARGRSSSRRW